MANFSLFHSAIKCQCPKCNTGHIFPHKFTLDVKNKCENCGFKLKDHDSGDGPAVFLVFILSALLTPLALLINSYIEIPLWAHAILWTGVSIAICLLTMQPLKTYFIALNYKHRGGAKGV